MHKLREELIKDIITFLDEGNYKTQDINIQNTITQIIVDTFDEYETDLPCDKIDSAELDNFRGIEVACSASLDNEFANESI